MENILSEELDPQAEAGALPSETSGAPDTAAPEQSQEDRDAEIYDRMMNEGGEEPSPRERDEQGRFKAKETDQSPLEGDNEPAEQAAEGEGEGDGPDPETEGGEQAESALEVPRNWSKEKAEAWQAMPRAAQEYILERDKSFDREIGRLGNEAGQLRPYGDLTEKYEDVFKEAQVEPLEGLERLIQAHLSLQNDPVTALTSLARQYGVDLASIGNSGMSPELQRLQSEIASLKAQSANAEREREFAERQASRSEEEQTLEQIDRWAADKPHFEKVRGIMGSLMEQGVTEDLDEAYKLACNAHPEISQELSAARKAEEDRKRREDAEKRALEAKKAKSVNVGKKGAQARGVPPPLDDKYDEDLYDRIQNGAV